MPAEYQRRRPPYTYRALSELTAPTKFGRACDGRQQRDLNPDLSVPLPAHHLFTVIVVFAVIFIVVLVQVKQIYLIGPKKMRPSRLATAYKKPFLAKIQESATLAGEQAWINPPYSPLRRAFSAEFQPHSLR
jgi:hypothetical protein